MTLDDVKLLVEWKLCVSPSQLLLHPITWSLRPC